MVLPVVKLVTLLIKQITRPLVINFAETIKQYPAFRNFVIRSAQRYHSMDFTSQSKLFGFGRPIKIKPLSEDEAVNLGSRLFVESSVYAISAGLILFEYNRSSNKEKVKEENTKYLISSLEHKINTLAMTTERQEAEIKEIRRSMFELDDKNRSLSSKLLGVLKGKQ